MATEKLEIQVSADVQSAVAGINQLNKAVAKTATELPKLNKATGQSTQTLTNFSRVVQDAPFGIIGIANNIDPLISSFQSLRASTGTTGAALRALFSSLAGPAGIAIAISTVTSALIFFTQNQQKAKKEVKETSEETQNFNAVLSQSVKSVVEEAGKVQSLVTALSTLSLSRKDQAKLINELKTLAPEYFGTLTRENDLITQLANSYFIYKNSISKAIQAKLIEADVNRVTKQLEEVEKIFKRLGDQESIRQLVGGRPTERRGTFTLESGEQLDINLLLQRRSTLQSVILGFQKQINSSNDDYIAKLLAGNNTIKEQVDILKQYREAIRLIQFNETALGVDLLNQKIDVASKTFQDFIEKGINPQSAAFKTLQTDLNNYLDAIKKIPKDLQRAETLPLEPSRAELPRRADRTSSVVITPEALRLQGQYALGLDETLEKLRKQQELVAGITEISGQFVDTFFGALANNQDPFEALAQSAKKLVAELAAAVVKALLLKAVTTALSGGATAGLDGLLGGGNGGGGGLLGLVLRGDLLTGAIGGNARRRRGF